MKFCKSLQRVIDVSDPAWAPYWMNYKLLKHIIKQLPPKAESEPTEQSSLSPRSRIVSVSSANDSTQQEDQATIPTNQPSTASETTSSGATTSTQTSKATLGKCPQEVTFFKAVHTELKKAEFFFDRATEEHEIRVDRVAAGLDMTLFPNTTTTTTTTTNTMGSASPTILPQSSKAQAELSSSDVTRRKAINHALTRLHKDLLLLETYAIMSYVGFSKILKKHDKVTGYATRQTFMENIVNKSTLAHYPRLVLLIQRCNELVASVEREGMRGPLSEDEQLFLSTIHSLNDEAREGKRSDEDDNDGERENVETGGIHHHAPTKSNAIRDSDEESACDDSTTKNQSTTTSCTGAVSVKRKQQQAETPDSPSSSKRARVAV